MGVGVAIGGVVGTDVKGGWRINAFLFLLTGWQAVLLPWLPLVLKTAGFTAQGVGVVTCVGAVSSSVGVGACLACVRKSRSGALRRLLLLLLLAAATALQIAAVALVQQREGGLHACSLPHTPPQHAAGSHGLPQQTTEGSHSTEQTLEESQVDTTTGLKEPTTTTTTTTTTTMTPTTTPWFNNLLSRPNEQSGGSEHLTTKLEGSTHVRTTTEGAGDPAGQASSGDDEGSSHDDGDDEGSSHDDGDDEGSSHDGDDEGSSDDEGDDEGSSQDKGDDEGSSVDEGDDEGSSYDKGDDEEGSSHDEGSSYEKGDDDEGSSHDEGSSQDDGDDEGSSYDKGDDEGSSKDAGDDDEGSSQDEGDDEGSSVDDEEGSSHDEGDDDEGSSQDEGDDEGSSVDDEEGSSHDEGDDEGYYQYHDKPGDRSPSGSSSSRPQGYPSPSQYPKPAYPPKTPLQIPQGIPWGSSSWFPTDEGQRGHKSQSSPSVISQDAFRAIGLGGGGEPSFNSYKGGLNDPSQRHLPQPPPVFRSADEAEQTPPEVGSKWPYHGLHQHSSYSMGFPSRAIMARPTANTGGHEDKRGYHRGRRSLPDLANRTESQTEASEGVGVRMGVAVLLVVGGLVGAGVEAAVAQLWHCYAHGYDEGGVSQDILQRTITHTFHLSAYASHKSWSGVTSGAWAAAGGVVSLLACAVGVQTGAYGGLAGVHLALGVCALGLMLFLPIPYGAVDPPRTRRPLSLYLDDEVLREGLRRLAFHGWVFAKGCLSALSLTFSLFLLQEMTTQGEALASQTGAVAVTLASEGASLLAHHWFMVRCGLQGTMGVAGLALTLHLACMWGAGGSVSIVVVSHAGLGLGMAAMWIVVKYNALLLATISDQEREAWVSWWAWRLGVGVGAAAWGMGVEGMGGRVRPLLPFAVVMAAVMVAVVGLAAALTRHQWRSHRRVYHTLDLDMDDDEEESLEDDWLVKRAKKEGISL